MNTIDIIIPTMWCDNNFLSYLKKYCEYSSINKIFVVDNAKLQRSDSEIFNHPKIKIVCYNKNIYVNPAWNEGYYRSKSDVLCLLNDDVFVEEEIFDYISELDMSEIDIIGSYLKGSIDNYHIVDYPDKKEELIKINVNKRQPIGGQSYAFGVCMFVKRSSYRVIPSLYKIWFGDDYLIQKCKNIYALKTSKISGEISKTIAKYTDKNDVQKRIDLDSLNAFKFNHFKGGKNWDIIKKSVVRAESRNKNIFQY